MLVYSSATISVLEFEVSWTKYYYRDFLSSETNLQYPTLIFGWIDFHFVIIHKQLTISNCQITLSRDFHMG